MSAEIFQWDDMSYWSTKDWETVQSRLEKSWFNPKKEDLFAALDATPWHQTKVAIMGQDPYPDPKYATGVAFSIPEDAQPIPPTLQSLFDELNRDLHYPSPKSGNLKKWTDQGVLLWNVIPSCEKWNSLSHNWDEWKYLTNEIISSLDDVNVIFVFLGAHARQYAPLVKSSKVLEYSHPVPRASLKSNKPFVGSRMFSTINALLKQEGQDTIDWRL